jgi:single-strand DNA-binding protein
MAGETQVTIVGNLTADPEMREVNGATVANFSVAVTPQTYDADSKSWKDGEATFYRVAAWRSLGEHIGASLHKGDRVLVLGNLKQRSYQDREGNQRTSFEIDATAVGPEMKWATVVINKSTRGGAPAQQQPPQQQGYPAQAPQGYPQQPGAYPQQPMAPQGYPPQGPPQGYPPQPPMQQPPQGYPPQGQPPQQPSVQQPPAQPYQQQPGYAGQPAYNDPTPF